MKIITVEAEEELLDALEKMAEAKSMTVDGLIREALQHYLQERRLAKTAYSFIGIGHSGQSHLSTQVDKVLAEAAHRREGWSLPE